jgi:DNA polymerase III alpha subunit (gram-positive type)
MRNLIFVDTESTGLADNPYTEIVELTWATLDSEPETLFFGVKEVPEFIDNLIGFTKRGIAGRQSDHFAIQRFLAASDGQTMVAANPGHDKHFIQEAGLWRFHYRMLDIESYAMAKLSLDEMPGMKNIFDELNKVIEITQPDHTSRNDVLAMREAFLYLESL